MKISEIFYSIQGEGSRAGTPTIFIRTSGCKAKFACLASGVNCDTEFESGKEMTKEELLQWIGTNCPQCKEVTWTGGEPTDQLTPEIVEYFKNNGFYQAIETSGLNPVPEGIDFICISPKVAEHVLEKNFKGIIVDELKYIRHKGQDIPQPKVEANHYFISPHSDGFNINIENVNHCINLIKKYPEWKLNLQMHKIWKVL